jgi:valyl-tRNA synthetase
VVCDAHLVDPAFGTGAVKLTPSHDMNDLEACKRAGLAWGRARVFGDDGKVALEGEFRGLSRFQLRRELRARLAALGLFRGSVPHAMVLARCSRSGDVIEPVLKPQWFVRVAALSASAKSQPIHFHPVGLVRRMWDGRLA